MKEKSSTLNESRIHTLSMKIPYVHLSKVVGFFFLISILFFALSYVDAGQVTIASFDFDGDYIDEVIRSDDHEGITTIKIYKRLKESYFLKPCEEFEVPGRLVQVPDFIDVNNDGMKDYFFATGSMRGVIYYNQIDKKFYRTSSFDFDAGVPGEKEREVNEVRHEEDEEKTIYSERGVVYSDTL